MARKLTEPMLRTLRIMAEGHEIELWWDSDGRRRRARYDYDPPVSTSPRRPHRNTVHALRWRGLIEEMDLLEDQPEYVVSRYALTQAGRRVAEGEG